MMKDILKRVFQLPLFEKTLAVLSADKEVSHFLARLPPYCTFYLPNSIRRVKRSGIRYELDLSDYMEWLVFYGIRVEPRAELYSLVQPNQVVLDIGANIGEVAFNLAQRVSDGGHVYSFEPDAANFRKLKRNLELNEFSNLTLVNLGFGEKSQRVTLAPEAKNNRGGVRVGKALDPNSDTTLLIPLDDWVMNAGIASVHLIKIDVEGYELKVLKGGEQTLRRLRPTLFIELSDANLRAQGDTPLELVKLLADYGYSEMRNADTGIKVGLMTDFANCHFDIIAQ